MQSLSHRNGYHAAAGDRVEPAAAFTDRQIEILSALADALASSSLARVLRTSCNVRGCQQPATQLVSAGLLESQLCSLHAKEHQVAIDRAFAGDRPLSQ